jgi:glycosyltransferase involved in cell wall biosynthesis
LGTLPGVRVAGGLADLRASIWGAAVYVSPLQTGFGRKTRLFEPMALGTPVVASGPTLAGVPYVEPGQHVLVADSDDDFAEAIARLLCEPLVANTLARNARTLIERRFTWAAVAERYEALYAGLAPSRAMEVAA